MRTSQAIAEVDDVDGELPHGVPVLSLENVSKTFAGTQALDAVDLDVRPGEVHALVGQNGSGKSTLIKLLAGYHQPDPGSVARYNGEGFHLGHRDTSGFSHIRFVHQDLGLVLEMSATENLALSAGFVTGASGRVHWREQEARTRASLARLGVDLDIRKPLGAATPVERTIVAIAAALTGWESGRGLLVLDEPTAVLPHTEVDRLLDIVRGIQRLGASVLYVSHRLDEIFKIADRVTVLRDGRVVVTRDTAGLDTQSLAELMVGDRVDAAFRLSRPPTVAEQSVLAVRDLAGGTLRNLTASVAPGEILGIAGFAGSGSEEVPYLLAGARAATGGEVKMAEGRWQPASRLASSGFPLVPADRQREAAVADFSVGENLTLRVVGGFTRAGAVSARREAEVVREWITKLQIKVSSPDASIMSLSGGNQQKVIMGRCLAADPRVLVLAEPTAGVDVGTRQAIYELIGDLADRGLAVVVTSTDTTDLIALCSRVVVLSRGEQSAELVGAEIDDRSLLAAMEAGR